MGYLLQWNMFGFVGLDRGSKMQTNTPVFKYAKEKSVKLKDVQVSLTEFRELTTE